MASNTTGDCPANSRSSGGRRSGKERLIGVGEHPAFAEAPSLFQEGAWLFAVAAIPLIINPVGIQVFDLPKIAFLRSLVVVLAMAWLWRQCCSGFPTFNGRLRVPWSDPRLRAGALSLAWLASTLTSIDPNLSLWGSYSRQEGLYTMLAYLLLFGLVATELRNQAQAERLVLAIALGSVPVILYGLGQWADLDPVPWHTTDKSPVLSTLGRSNFVGSYLVMSIPLTIAAILLRRRPWLRLSLILGLSGSLALLGLTKARSAWVAVLLMALAALVLTITLRGSLRRFAPHFALAAAALFVFLAVFLGTLAISGRPQDGAFLRLPELSGSFAARLTIWQASLQLIAERPFLGFGPDSFALAFHHVFPPQLVFYQGRDVITDRAHNVLLQQAVTTGLLGLTAYLALIGALLATLMRGLRFSQRRSRIVLVAIVAAVIGHLADLLFSFDVASTAVVFWVVAGAGIGLSRTLLAGPTSQRQVGQITGRETQKRGRPIAAALVVIALVTILGTNVAPLAADTYAGQAMRLESPLPARLTSASQAAGLWPFEPTHQAGLAMLYLERARDETDPEASLDLAEQRMADALAKRPLDPLFWASLAQLQGYRAMRQNDQQAFRAAETAYQRAIALAPNNAVLHMAYGTLELWGGRPDLAAMWLEQAVYLDPTEPRAWSFLAETYRVLGRTAEAANALANVPLAEAAVQRGLKGQGLAALPR